MQIVWPERHLQLVAKCCEILIWSWTREARKMQKAEKEREREKEECSG